MKRESVREWPSMRDGGESGVSGGVLSGDSTVGDDATVESASGATSFGAAGPRTYRS